MFGINPLTAYIGAGLAAVILLMGVAWKLDHAHLKREAARWEAVAATYRADLGTCRDNTGKLEGALEAQNAAYTAMSDEAAKMQRNAQEAVTAQRRASETARKEMAAFMARKPRGETVCARVEDVAAEIRKAG